MQVYLEELGCGIKLHAGTDERIRGCKSTGYEQPQE